MAVTRTRQRQPLKQSTKDKIRAAMLRNGHRPPSQRGAIRSAEVRERISAAKLGRHHSLEVRRRMAITRTGPGNHFYGKKHTDDALELMREAKLGKKPPNWIEDRTKVKLDKERGGPLHKQWSKAVKTRDNWQCQLPNQDCEGQVVAHHIKPWASFPELRYQTKNGITLCHFHHPRTRAGEERLAPTLTELVLAKA